MKKALLLKPMLLLFALIVGSSSVWADKSTLTFTAACGGSGTADDGVTWTVTSDATESTFDNTKGIHYGTSSVQVKYIKLTTSDITGTISSVKVNASTASGVTATVDVTVGGDAFGGDPQSLTSSAADYTFSGSKSGEIIVTVTKPSKATKALYVKSIVVTYTPSSGSGPSLDADDVELLYNDTSGSIEYTINNEVTGATILATTTANWISNFSYSTEGEVTFSTTVNESYAEREGTVTLKYMNGNEELASKNVKVIQKKHPFVITDGYFDFTQGEDYGSGLEASTTLQVFTSTWTAGNVTLVIAGRNSWQNGTEIRLYKEYNTNNSTEPAGSITLSVPTGYVITNIAFTGKSLGNISANVDQYESANWEGCSNSVIFTASERTDIYTITVTYGRVITPAKAVTTFVTTDILDFENVEGGLEAFVATAAANGVVTLAKVGAVPAGTPLLLRGTASTNYTVPVVASATAPTTNLLRAGDGTTPVGGPGVYDYVLSNGKWYHIGPDASAVNVGKAYLHCEEDPLAGGAPDLSMDWGEGTTAIKSIERTINDNQYYTLDGRRVAEPTKGLYILNGKKVIVK